MAPEPNATFIILRKPGRRRSCIRFSIARGRGLRSHAETHVRAVKLRDVRQLRYRTSRRRTNTVSPMRERSHAQ